jgi:DNA-binding NarL/FixJ family response regulator
MPVMNGIEATKRICGACEKTKVVILSMYHTSDYIQRALDAGAAGYLLKDSAGTELIAAIRDIHAGKSYFSQKATRS